MASTGLQKWRKNLQLLVPFLLEPRIDLLYLSELSDVLATGNGSAQRLKVTCICNFLRAAPRCELRQSAVPQLLLKNAQCTCSNRALPRLPQALECKKARPMSIHEVNADRPVLLSPA